MNGQSGSSSSRCCYTTARSCPPLQKSLNSRVTLNPIMLMFLPLYTYGRIEQSRRHGMKVPDWIMSKQAQRAEVSNHKGYLIGILSITAIILPLLTSTGDYSETLRIASWWRWFPHSLKKLTINQKHQLPRNTISSVDRLADLNLLIWLLSGDFSHSSMHRPAMPCAAISQGCISASCERS